MLLLYIIRGILFFLVALVTLLQVTCKSCSESCRRQRANEETINEAIIIGREEGDLHELKGHSEATMTHAI